MEFNLHGAIQQIVRAHNPTSKICRREDSIVSRAASRQHLAVAVLIKLGPRYKPEKIRPEKLRQGSPLGDAARSRLTARPRGRRGNDSRAGGQLRSPHPRVLSPIRGGPGAPLALPDRPVYDSVKGGLKALIRKSENRRRHCLFGRSCGDDAFFGDAASQSQYSRPSRSGHASPLPRLQSSAAAPRSPGASTPWPQASCGTFSSPVPQGQGREVGSPGPHSVRSQQSAPRSPATPDGSSFFITAQQQGTVPSSKRPALGGPVSTQPPATPRAEASGAGRSWQRSGGARSKPRFDQFQEEEPLPQLRTVTVRDVADHALRRRVLEDSDPNLDPDRRNFAKMTQELFDASEAKPVLRYQRQSPREKQVRGAAPASAGRSPPRAGQPRTAQQSPRQRAAAARIAAVAAGTKMLHPDDAASDANDADHGAFRAWMQQDARSFVARASDELDRYEDESQQLFRQKYAALDIGQLLGKRRSATHAIRSIETKIRRQHERAWAQQRREQQKEWLGDLQVVVDSALPLSSQSRAVQRIIRFLEEYITRGDEGSKKPEEWFEELVHRRLRRADLLLDGALSVLFAVRFVFRLSTEAFCDVIRERLRPLNQRALDQRGFEQRFRAFQVQQVLAFFSGRGQRQEKRPPPRAAPQPTPAPAAQPAAGVDQPAAAVAAAAALAAAAAAAKRRAAAAPPSVAPPPARPRLTMRDFRLFLGMAAGLGDDVARAARENCSTEEHFLGLTKVCGCEPAGDGPPGLDAEGFKKWYDQSYSSAAEGLRALEAHYRRVQQLLADDAPPVSGGWLSGPAAGQPAAGAKVRPLITVDKREEEERRRKLGKGQQGPPQQQQAPLDPEEESMRGGRLGAKRNRASHSPPAQATPRTATTVLGETQQSRSAALSGQALPTVAAHGRGQSEALTEDGD